MFVDKVWLIAISGNGGNGIVSFRREKFVPKGGPDGGDGGKGGNIVFRVDFNLNNLYHLRHTPTIKAGKGGNGKKKRMHGRNGKDAIVNLPPGTTVLDENGKIICDLIKPNQEEIILSGGKGGKGNIHFATSRNQVPEHSTQGKKGRTVKLTLELKSIADIGIVGYPNAGKSTLLAKISSATPKISDYPFTTLSPNLGVVEFEDFTRLTFADIPGVIKGASKGKGLGFEFLRHIERTKLLLILIDITSSTLIKDFFSIMDELRAYNQILLKYPKVIVLNKIDIMKEEIPKPEFKEKTFFVSALSGKGITNLINEIKNIYKNIGGDNGKEKE